MRIFQGRVEITAEYAVPGLRAGHSNGLSNAHIGLTDAAMGEFARPAGAACDAMPRPFFRLRQALIL